MRVIKLTESPIVHYLNVFADGNIITDARLFVKKVLLLRGVIGILYYPFDSPEEYHENILKIGYVKDFSDITKMDEIILLYPYQNAVVKKGEAYGLQSATLDKYGRISIWYIDYDTNLYYIRVYKYPSDGTYVEYALNLINTQYYLDSWGAGDLYWTDNADSFIISHSSWNISTGYKALCLSKYNGNTLLKTVEVSHFDIVGVNLVPPYGALYKIDNYGTYKDFYVFFNGGDYRAKRWCIHKVLQDNNGIISDTTDYIDCIFGDYPNHYMKDIDIQVSITQDQYINGTYWTISARLEDPDNGIYGNWTDITVKYDSQIYNTTQIWDGYVQRINFGIFPVNSNSDNIYIAYVKDKYYAYPPWILTRELYIGIYDFDLNFIGEYLIDYSSGYGLTIGIRFFRIQQIKDKIYISYDKEDKFYVSVFDIPSKTVINTMQVTLNQVWLDGYQSTIFLTDGNKIYLFLLALTYDSITGSYLPKILYSDINDINNFKELNTNLPPSDNLNNGFTYFNDHSAAYEYEIIDKDNPEMNQHGVAMLDILGGFYSQMPLNYFVDKIQSKKF